MSIESIGTLAPPDFSGVGSAGGAREIARPGDAGGSFTEALGNAIEKVDGVQLGADAQADKVAMGGGNLHEMSLALEKADVSMRLAMKVRSKIVDAYQEIMRMGV